MNFLSHACKLYQIGMAIGIKTNFIQQKEKTMKTIIKELSVSRIFLQAIFIAIAAMTVSTARAEFTKLHDFGVISSDGRSPYYVTPVTDGTHIYGTTRYGGVVDHGTVFRMNIDGTGYLNLHSFAGGAANGMNPLAGLTLSNGVLYGTTLSGGSNNYGIIFKIGTNGNNYTKMHEFSGGVNDGGGPQARLLLSGSTLYGTTRDGGDLNIGVIFKIDTDGSNYAVLHEFMGGNNDGSEPIGGLILSGGSLYGMTTIGGSNDYGVIFKIDTDGNNFTNIHSFAGVPEGEYPYGELTSYGGALYGMTSDGGSSDYGAIFRINPDGSGYTNVYNFSAYSFDGQDPYGHLTLHNGSFYGLTPFGGMNSGGIIFRMDIDGSSFTNLHSFHSSADGSDPRGSLLEIADYFYGFTSSGGADNYGIAFEYTDIPEPVGIWIVGLLECWIIVKRHKRVPGECPGQTSNVKL